MVNTWIIFLLSLTVHIGLIGWVGGSSLKKSFALSQGSVIHLRVLPGPPSQTADISPTPQANNFYEKKFTHISFEKKISKKFRLTSRAKDLSAIKFAPKNSDSNKNTPHLHSTLADQTNGSGGAGDEGRSQEKPLGIGSLSQPPRLIPGTVYLPPYTDDARAAKFQGTLEVDITTDESGRVTSATLNNPSGFDLDHGVLEVARLALYYPLVGSDGKTQPGLAKLRFRFHLEDEPSSGDYAPQ